MFTEMSGDLADREMAEQFERIIRRVKRSMSYRGSYSTQDILASLVTRWVQSGEWERLKGLPAAERRIGESVRRFILDRLDQLRRRGERAEVEELAIPDDAELEGMIEIAELRGWIQQRIGELERGVTDPRCTIKLSAPEEVGVVLRLHMEGKTQRQIAEELGVSLGLVNKRVAEGTSYLVVVQGIEQGLS